MRGNENREPLTITKVVPLEGRRLKLSLSTGSELILDMSNRLNTVRFCPLKDGKIFESVTTDGYYLHFNLTPNYALDFTLKEAIQMTVSTPDHPIYETDFQSF